MALPTLTYAFRARKKIKPEFVRILGEIAAQGRGLARLSRGSGDEAIHDGRLLIKRTRALLWFVRPALNLKLYEAVKVQLRAAAELMSSHRDSAVIQNTLQELAVKAKADDGAALKEITKQVIGKSPRDVAEGKNPWTVLKKAMGILDRSISEIQHHAKRRDDWPSADKRVKKAFRAMHKAEKKARETGGDADVHEWRKKTKRLLYVLELTTPEPGRHMKRTIKGVAELQDHLGSTHDCAVAEAHLRKLVPAHAALARSVLPLLAKRKAKLGEKSAKIAHRLKESGV
jgi:CHAD domain-containing protein